MCPTCGQYGHSSRLDTILWAIWWTFSCGSKDALLQSFCSCIGYTSSPERIQQCTYLTCGHYGHSIGLVGHWTLDRTPFCGRYGGRHSMADNISLPLSSCFSCIPTIVETLLPDNAFTVFIYSTFLFTSTGLCFKAMKYISVSVTQIPHDHDKYVYIRLTSGI